MEILGGPLFAVAGAGESHGPAITTIVMGCPPGTWIDRETVQADLDRRRPGGNKHGTPRNEKDKVILTSGIYQPDSDDLLAGGSVRVEVDQNKFETEGYRRGHSTGEPIAAIVLSTSKKSADYSQLDGPGGEVRPGHTDLVKWHQSGGFVDVRGGGRSSYRSTISDVIGGAVAKSYLHAQFGTVFLSSITRVGTIDADVRLSDALATDDASEIVRRIGENEIPTVDSAFSSTAAELIKATRKQGDSLGALVEIVAVNVPPLVGSPLYDSLKVRLMGSLGGLNAVQSCEIGDGIDVTSRRGSENNDAIRVDGYVTNAHGGLIGGITTGKPLVVRVGFKPTSTIHRPQKSVRKNLEEIDFELDKGRHDPCVGVRAGVTLEARMAIELANAVLAVGATRTNAKTLPGLFGNR